MFGAETGGGGWGSAAATGHSAGQTADGAVKGSAARTTAAALQTKLSLHACVFMTLKSPGSALSLKLPKNPAIACCLN